MVSLIILLLGLFTAGIVVGVFIMALLELKQIDAMTGKHSEAGTPRPPLAAESASSIKPS
ncbi:hypothetical protein [Noviherbaspirillum aerium]|uniref:hypothetical protein n=1 Tax=Noviherbaspirillum aerium TaxID=2588497 RepID=UPI00124E820D|nr:hypothetical protein [Noviherbaspirillum aerium]